jgi:hypothetical protein
MKLPKHESIAFVLIIFFTLVVFCKKEEKQIGVAVEKPLGPKLIWQTGTWWIVQTSFFRNISRIKDGPEKLGVIDYFHRYTVVKKKQLGSEEVWIVDINAMNVPKEFPNDQGDKYLWRVYLSAQNFTLRKIISSTREGNYLVTGNQVKNDTIDFRLGNPAVVTRLVALTPLEFPRLPVGSNPLLLEEKEKESDFTNELSFQKYKETIIAAFQQIGKQQIPVWYITLANKDNGISTHYWVPGLPWWKEWRHDSLERKTGEMFKAELVEWGIDRK